MIKPYLSRKTQPSQQCQRNPSDVSKLKFVFATGRERKIQHATGTVPFQLRLHVRSASLLYFTPSPPLRPPLTTALCTHVPGLLLRLPSQVSPPSVVLTLEIYSEKECRHEPSIHSHTLHGGIEIVLELDIEPENGAFRGLFKMADLFYTPESRLFPLFPASLWRYIFISFEVLCMKGYCKWHSLHLEY